MEYNRAIDAMPLAGSILPAFGEDEVWGRDALWCWGEYIWYYLPLPEVVVAPEAEPDVAEPEPDAGDSFAELWELVPIGLELELGAVVPEWEPPGPGPEPVAPLFIPSKFLPVLFPPWSPRSGAEPLPTRDSP